MNNKVTGSKQSSAVVTIAAILIIISVLVYAKSIITPILLALFISIICIQPVSWLEKKRIPSWLALIMVIIGLIALFSGFTFLIGGTLSSFSGNLPKYESTLSAISKSVIQYLSAKGVNISGDQVSTLIQPARILEFTSSALNGLFSVMGNTLLIFLTVLFILTEFGSFSVKAKAILSGSDKSIAYFSTITQNIRQYLWIKTLIGLLEGVIIYVTLLIIGVDYALLWALISFLMNYIPNIGSFIALIPTVLFALIQLGFGGALWTLGAFIVIHNIIGNFLEPRIMGKGLGLSTLVVFLSLLFWGFVFGPVGMFLSVPITMTIKIILEQNEETLWLAILLGTPTEAKNHLLKKEKNKELQDKISDMKDKK